MKHVLVKDRYQYLLTSDEDIPSSVAINGGTRDVVGNVAESMQDYMINNPIRPLLTYSAITEKFNVSFIFWYRYSLKQLEDLDENIKNDEELKISFDNTVILEYQKTRCWGKCRKWWDTLIIPHYSTTDESSSNKAPWASVMCPECNGSLRQSVVVVIDQAKEAS